MTTTKNSQPTTQPINADELNQVTGGCPGGHGPGFPMPPQGGPPFPGFGGPGGGGDGGGGGDEG